MQSHFKQSKLFLWTVELVLTIIGIYFTLQMPSIFNPILKMLSAVFLLLLVAGFIYYMFDPIAVFLGKHQIPGVFGFLLTFLVVIVLVVLTVMNVAPQLIEQTAQLTQSLPVYTDETSRWLSELAQREEFENFNLEERLASASLSLSNLFNIILVSLSASVSKIISFMMQFFILLFTAPFILLFMFKDRHKFIDASSHFFPKAIRKELRQTVKELNEILSTYISNTVLDALIISVINFLAMRILDRPYNSLLAVVCEITNTIPYAGPFIGAVPAIIVGLFISPLQALYMALSILVIQQLDGNLTKPLLFGKSMNIHPLTVILVLIGAGSVAGILGTLVYIPVYAVIKTVILDIRKIYLSRRMERVSEKLDSPKVLEETNE